MSLRVRQGERTSIMTQGGAQAPLDERDYCPIDGCYSLNRGNGQGTMCERHYTQLRRKGTTKVDERYTDRVPQSGGAACGVCGRSVYEHGVTEFCELMLRAS